jgi:hypothetical protein
VTKSGAETLKLDVWTTAFGFAFADLADCAPPTDAKAIAIAAPPASARVKPEYDMTFLLAD